MPTPTNVVDQARTWLGTPYHHQARLKGVGVDCIGLVIGVARELALVPPDFDIGGYAKEPDGVSLIETAALHMVPIEREQLAPGHVLAVAFDAQPQHFGIVGDYRHGGLSIIHASGAGDNPRVIETRLLFGSAIKYVAAYALPNLEYPVPEMGVFDVSPAAVLELLTGGQA